MFKVGLSSGSYLQFDLGARILIINYFIMHAPELRTVKVLKLFSYFENGCDIIIHLHAYTLVLHLCVSMCTVSCENHESVSISYVNRAILGLQLFLENQIEEKYGEKLRKNRR